MTDDHHYYCHPFPPQNRIIPPQNRIRRRTESRVTSTATQSFFVKMTMKRGLLDDTLVLRFSEHGRTPKITNTPGGGREHWSRVYFALLAGAGIARGRVVGQGDAIGGDVVHTPVSPKDLLATAFRQLGIDPPATAPDHFGRPWPIAGTGVVRTELLN